jgi:large subunit ribosomal protein L27
VKLFGGQKAISGNIIVKQKGNKFWPAEGVSQGRDFTLYATREGTVTFTQKKRTRFDGRKYKDTYISVV